MKIYKIMRRFYVCLQKKQMIIDFFNKLIIINYNSDDDKSVTGKAGIQRVSGW